MGREIGFNFGKKRRNKYTSGKITKYHGVEPEVIRIKPSSVITEKIGNSLTVTCSVECKPDCTVSWKKSESLLENNNELKFPNLTRLNDGEYTCHAENEYGSSDEDLTIHIHYKPILVSEKLKDMKFKELRIKELSNVNITLEIDSNPEPDITWIKSGKILPDNDTTMMLSGPVVRQVTNINKYMYNSVYKIIQAQCTDMANYSARISNQYGEISSSAFHLKVSCKPRIEDGEYFKTEFAPELGETIDINMRVIAYPAPVISTIYHNGSVIPISVFNITHYTPSDYLTVFTITKHVQTLNDLGIYHVELSNDEDRVNITVHFKDKGSPSTPQDLRVSEIKALSILLQWTSTFNGGEKQTFSVWYKHLYGNWTFYNQTYHDPGEGSTVKAEIKGLRDLTAYMFQVRAKNKYGMSDFTPSLPVTTIELTKTPVENAGMSTADIGMWAGISIALVVLIIAVIIAIFFIRRKYQEKKKDKFFKEIRDAGDPMMPGQFLELSNKENHLYEEILEHRLSRAGSPSTNSNGTSSHERKPAPTSAPPKPPRTFEEPTPKKPEPIWKPVEKKAPKVNENTLHLAVARKSLKPVTNKGQL
ncbi:hypothetical protein LOTGIDRAFT_237566 [Lottia gigantea]|uniref:Ig-like domain-containing protein n=1 Tax=Lottia gigantea TaxID=225164 RepID=V4AHV3_LOTGI|nr:hypothetical protein LOTGIDRAFT_237566 [Lottia gigantea]ESP03649.1 hypothetical protein LOTGIDRAFT_237566 [Lottia gigantea]